MKVRGPVAVFVFALFWNGNAVKADPAVSVLHSAREVHELPAARVANTRAEFEGVVTYYDPLEQILFVQDHTGGVFIDVTKPYPVRTGDLVEIRGGVKPGYRTEVASDVLLRRLGSGYPIIPVDVGYPVLASGQVDSTLVRISGTVRAAAVETHPEAHSETLHLNLALGDGEVEVYVEDYKGINPLDLLGKKIALSGVAGGAFNAREQMTGVILYAHNREDISILGQTEPPYQTLPLVSPDKIFSYLQVRDTSPRLRIHGTVLYFAPGESAVVEHDGSSVFLQTRQTAGVEVGDVVDAYGFPDTRSYSPSLRQTVLVPTGEREQIAPTPVDYKAAMNGLYSDRLVAMQGKVLSQLRTPEANSITLEIEGHVVRGIVQDPDDVPALRLGSIVRLSGICRIVPGGPWQQPTLFFLSVRSASDITVLRAPSWWDVQHLAESLSLLLFIALVTIIWALVLRRRVARQAARIERSMCISEKRSSILQRISSNLPLENVLTSLCTVVEELLPGATCAFSLTDPVGGKIPKSPSQSLFYCPLTEDGEAVGGFTILAATSSFSETAYTEVFAMVDELVAIATRNSMLHKQLIHRSTHDPLTELPNRRLCETRIEEAVIEARMAGSCFSLIYVDVDQFKLVNDEYGHRVGDHYLQAIGRRLVGALRSECTVARVGGDEFVVILPGSPAEEAKMMMQRLSDCFATAFALGSIPLKGSASFGLACFPAHGESKEELEQHADIAMYAAKRQHSAGDVLF